MIVISGQSAIIAEAAENIVTGDAALNATVEADALLALAKAIASAAATGMNLITQMEDINAVQVLLDGAENAAIGVRMSVLHGAELATTSALVDKSGTKLEVVTFRYHHAKAHVVETRIPG